MFLENLCHDVLSETRNVRSTPSMVLFFVQEFQSCEIVVAQPFPRFEVNLLYLVPCEFIDKLRDWDSFRGVWGRRDVKVVLGIVSRSARQR